MDLFAIDFDEKIWESYFSYSEGSLFSDEEFADMTTQADVVINNEKEDPKRRAEACVKKFQLLETRYKLAPKLLEKALELYTDMPQALTNMGRFYLDIGNREKALEYFSKTVDTDPSYPYAWLEKASLEKDREEEIRFYSEFIKLKPDSKIGYEKRCHVVSNYKLMDLDSHASIGDTVLIIKQAIKDYTELIRLDQSNWNYYESRAELYLRESKIYRIIYREADLSSCLINDAVKDIEHIMLLYPKDNVGNCITIVNNLFVEWLSENTARYITQIIDDLPSDSVAYFIAQILLAEQYEYKDNEKAIEIYSKAINSLKDGEDLRLYCFSHRGSIYSHIGEFDKALADYAMIIQFGSALSEKKHSSYECDPYYARENRANIYKELNDLARAINEYTSSLRELSNTDEKYLVSIAYFKRAELFMENGESDKALADYSSVIDLGISGVTCSVKDAYAARIEIYKARGEMDKAFADYIKMSELKEEDSFGLEDFVPQKFEILD